MQPIPLTELQGRVQRLQDRLQHISLDGALIMQNMDLFYYAGSMQQGFFFVPAAGEPLYLVRRNFERARQESLWENICPLGGLSELSRVLANHGFSGLEKIGLQLDVIPVNNFQRLTDAWPGVVPADISPQLREIRMLKSAYEIDCFRRAGELALAVNRQIPALLQVGKAEIHLSAEIENLYRRAGHQGLLRMRAFNAEMYFGHVYSGQNGTLHTFLDSCTGGSGVTAACPQGAGWKKINPHEPIGVDYGAIYDGYILDHTRVFSIGELPADLQRAYAVAVEIQNLLIGCARPGASCAELYSIAVELAGQRGLADYFMGCGPEKVKFAGHGLGLEIDELPVIGLGSPHLLQEGMVFALEPKFIFPGRGMVGLENVWYITAQGAEKLSPIPDDLVIVSN